jgi:phage shock protein A
MFENLRDAFREAVENFKHELNAEDAPVTVDRLLLAMQDELAQTRGVLLALERQIADASAQAARDRSEEDTCRRRAEMAGRVGDAETARIALEFAVRHEKRRVVMERKVAALDEERALRVLEVQEMTVRVEEARATRATLGDSGSADHATDRLDTPEDLYDELDRMAEGMRPSQRAERRSRMDDLEREFDELKVDPWAPGPRRLTDEDVDAALEELKRRMGNPGKE